MRPSRSRRANRAALRLATWSARFGAADRLATAEACRKAARAARFTA